jgi:hypothetical protein
MTGPPIVGPAWEEIVTRVTVAGDAPALAAAADAWERTLRGLGELAKNLRVLAQRTRHAWGGGPAEVFGSRLEDQALRLETLVSTYGPVVGALRSCGRHLGAAVEAIPIPSDHVADVLERRREFRRSGTLGDITPGSFRPPTAEPLLAQDWLAEQHRVATQAYQRLREEYARDLALFPTGTAPPAATAATGADAAPHARNGDGTGTPTPPALASLASAGGIPAPGVAPTIRAPGDGSWPEPPTHHHDDRPTDLWSGGLAGVGSSAVGVVSGAGVPVGGLGPVVSPPATPGGPTASAGALPFTQLAAGPAVGARGAPAGMNGMYALPLGGAGASIAAGAAAEHRLPLVDADGTFTPPGEAPYGVLDNP